MKFCFFILLCVGIRAANAQVPVNGLIGRWEFSGNASDQSGSGNNGTVFGATLVSDRSGNPASAYSFNGINNYIQMPQSGPTGNSSRSVSFWAKTTYTASGNGNLAMVPFTYGTWGMGAAFQVQLNYNCQGLGLDVGNEEIIRGDGCFSDNQWHHFVLVHNSAGNQQLNSVDFYIDGQLLPQISCFQTGTSQTINTGPSGILMGTEGSFPSAFRWFNGSLDDIYLYNRAITPAEVLQLFTVLSSLSGNSAPCLGQASTYSVPAAGSTYTWTLPGGWSGASSANTIQTIPSATAGTINVSYVNSCGARVTQALPVAAVPCETTALAPQAVLWQVSLLPNPADKELLISGLPEQMPYVLKIYDLRGVEVYHSEGSGSQRHPISELSAGVYYAELSCESGQVKKRLLKL